jgi:hypothetical protein
VVVGRGVGSQHLRHARQPGRGRGGGSHAAACDQDMHQAEPAGGGDGAARGLLDPTPLMVEQNEDGHGQITFASVFSFLTSSATEATFTPTLRLGGSKTLSTFSRGAGSTPRSAGFRVSIGFLRAFMMLGRLA